MADDAGDDPAASLAVTKAAHAAGYSVSVLGVGTEAGSTLQTADGTAIRTRAGADVTARLDVAAMTGLAQAGGGAFSVVTPTGPTSPGCCPTCRDRCKARAMPVI